MTPSREHKRMVTTVTRDVTLVLVFVVVMCYSCVSTTPMHRTELIRSSDPHSRVSHLRDMLDLVPVTDDVPVYHETSRPSVLLKRSRRISRTTLGVNVTDSRTPEGRFSRTTGHYFKSRPPQPCSHIGDGTNDVAARAYLAGVVFEGKARSRSADKGPGGMYAVTFSVQHVYKDTNPVALRLRSQVRLNFKEKTRPSTPRPCVQDFNYTSRSSELVKANIKSGGKYLVFVSGAGPRNYTVLGEPVFRTKKNLQAVRDVLCQNCVRPVGIFGLRDVTVNETDRLRLVCRCKGNPLPALHWLKNGESINVSRSLRIQYKKKRSSLLIPKVRPKDAGKYECVAVGVMGETKVAGATVTVNGMRTFNKHNENTTILWPIEGMPCPYDLFFYCLNGGNCTFYKSVGEPVCQCAEGFKGARCESKDILNRSSMYNTPLTYFCKLGISNSYYC
uniref:Protein vein n=1 Tax=Clastoptera arizonana TaxID=38151 RepID=A0A1B6DH23_9HEMI